MVNDFRSSEHHFVPYDQLNSSPNIIVDGAATTGTVLTLSHWPKSGTPPDLRRDTSSEIVFAYLDSPAPRVNANAVSNNHFDEDGLVGIFALTNLSAAEKYRELLVDVANAGDFGVYRRREAARIAFTISACADSKASPLPKELFEMPYQQMAGQLYEYILNIFPQLLTDLNGYKHLWEAEDVKLSASEKLIENGDITIEERPGLDLAIVNMPVGLPPTRVHRFTRVCLTECHPFALHNRTKCTRLLVVQGQHVEFQYRYESWVQLASRRPPLRVDLGDLALEFNQEEESEGRWVFDGVESITPRLHLDGASTTTLSPDAICRRLEDRLSTGVPAWNPYDD